MMIRQQMVCGICVYGPQTGRTKAEKEAFREELEMLAGLSDGQTMQFVAGDYNAHIGVVEPWDEESIGRFGCGTRNGERNKEWRQYKDAFVGVAQELRGRTSEKGGTPRTRNQGWWTEEVAKAVGEKWEAWKIIEGIGDRGGNHTPA